MSDLSTLSCADIDAYLATKADGERIGTARDAHHCLVAEAYRWKYSLLPEIVVAVNRYHISAYWRFGDGWVARFATPDELQPLIGRFDAVARGQIGMTAITKWQWQESEKQPR